MPDLEVHLIGPMTPERAARFIAAEAWPNERFENRDSWAPKMIEDRDMAIATIASAQARIGLRLTHLAAATRVLLGPEPEPATGEDP